jgi:hypothetical protein
MWASLVDVRSVRAHDARNIGQVAYAVCRAHLQPNGDGSVGDIDSATSDPGDTVTGI